jgi:hypothetical protein
MEGDPTPNEAPTSRLVLTDEDLDRIKEAIRDGLEKKPPDRPKLLREVLAVIVGFGLLFLLYLALTHWRPSVDLNVQANALATTEVLTHRQEDSVEWSVGTGLVRELTVEELRATEEQPAAQFTISLPIPTTDCEEVAAALDATCDGGVIEVQARVTVTWTTPQVLQLMQSTTRDQVQSQTDQLPLRLRLTLQRPSANTLGTSGESADDAAEETEPGPATAPLPQLALADWQTASQQWCFTYQSNAAATLSISGGSGGYQRSFEPASAPNVVCDGLQLQVIPGAATLRAPDGSQGGSATETPEAMTSLPAEQQRASSVVTLAGISSLGITTSTQNLGASALTGTLRIGQDVRAFDTATHADFRGGELRSSLEVQAGTPSLTIAGDGVTSIETDRGNLVATVWQRNPELILPIFLGLVGVLIPLLGAAYRNGVDYLTRRRSSTRSAAH